MSTKLCFHKKCLAIAVAIKENGFGWVFENIFPCPAKLKWEYIEINGIY